MSACLRLRIARAGSGLEARNGGREPRREMRCHVHVRLFPSCSIYGVNEGCRHSVTHAPRRTRAVADRSGSGESLKNGTTTGLVLRLKESGGGYAEHSMCDPSLFDCVCWRNCLGDARPLRRCGRNGRRDRASGQNVLIVLPADANSCNAVMEGVPAFGYSGWRLRVECC